MTDGLKWSRRGVVSSVAFIIGAGVSMAVIWPIAARYSWTFPRALIWGAGLALLFGAFASIGLERVVRPGRVAFSSTGWCGLLVGCALGGVVLTASLGLHLPRMHRLELRVTGEANPAGHDQEVWLISIAPEGRAPVPFDTLSRQGSWEVKHGVLMSRQPGATAIWEGLADSAVRLTFVSHPWSGRVDVTWDGLVQHLDLYSPFSTQRAVVLAPEMSSSWARSLLFWFGCSAALGFLLLMTIALGMRLVPDDGPTRPECWSWVGYAVPCVFVWSGYLLAFWPGVMTPDSLDQWSQVLRGSFINNHPVFHTLTNSVFLHLVRSPAALGIPQILALASVFGLTVRELEAWRVPGWARWALVVAFAFAPANGILTVTLWKDIFYTIAMLGLTGLMLRFVLTSGECLRSRGFAVLLYIACCGVCLYRHNGVLVVGLLALALPASVGRGLRGRAFGLTAGAVLTFALITGPVYRRFGIHPMGKVFALQVQMHQLGAIISSDPALPASTLSLLEEVEPLEAWRSGYYCFSVNGVIYNGKVDAAFVDAHAPEILKTWLTLLPSHWRTVVHHQLCATSLIWRIHPPSTGYLYAYSDGIEPNPFGLTQAPKWPALRSVLVKMLHGSMQSAFIDWVWRPATYVYVLLLVGVILALRLRKWRALMIIAPATFNALVLMGINLSQDFRYEYPVFVAGLVLAPLLAARARPQTAESSVSAASASDDSERVRSGVAQVA